MSASLTLSGTELTEILSVIAATDLDLAELLADRAGLDPATFQER